MSPQEYANCKIVAEMYRRQRRENQRLREALGQRTEAQRIFDQEDREAFALVEMNRQRLLCSSPAM